MGSFFDFPLQWKRERKRERERERERERDSICIFNGDVCKCT